MFRFFGAFSQNRGVLSLKKMLLLNTFTKDRFELPDIFVYLVDTKNKPEKRNVCFQRIKADELGI